MRRLFDPYGGPASQNGLTATDWDMDSDEEDSSYGPRAAYRKAKRRRKKSPGGTSNTSAGGIKVKGDGHVLNGFNRRTGGRNRCDTCDGGYHLAPKCPRRKHGKPTSMSSPPSVKKAPRSSFPATSMGNSASVCMEGSRNPKEIRGYCEQSCSTTLEAGSQLIRMKEGSVATLETGAAPNLVCFPR